ncbi:MAG: hypothetical protein B7Z66_05885 [Chromatiales bacterium 21-64-14]|nr:MAG: hypothetical protein B7Z66_05885 [Chromatiales bacterium 21-64-14]
MAGIPVPTSARPVPDGPVLPLNGVGVRHKYFLRIYVAALYLPRPADSLNGVLSQPGPKRIWMHFLYYRVSRSQLVGGWLEGFRANLGSTEFQALSARITAFNAMFETLHRGDAVLLDYVPGIGTRVTVRGRERGVIPGADFYRALLRIWLGDHPADGGLKRALLAGHPPGPQ